MTTDLATRNVELSNEQLQFIANTEFVPRDLRGNLPAILACVATGRALGIADMTALRSIHVIDGKATFSAELMVMLVRKAGHSITGAVKDGSAVVIGTRADNGDTMTVTWTRAMAEQAGLLSKQNWRKYEESMLWARGASQLCRMLFPDCFAGATYTPEELEVDRRPSVDEEGEVQLTHADTLAVMAESTTKHPPCLLCGFRSGHRLDCPNSRHEQGSAGEPEAGLTATGATPSPPVHPSRGPSEDEPTSPADEIAQAAKATGLEVDMADPAIPFGDAPPVRYITERQRTRLFTIAGNAGVPEPDVRAIVLELTGQESTKLIPSGQVYNTIIATIQGKGTA